MPDPLQRALVALDGLSLPDPNGASTQAALALVEVLKRRGGLESGDVAATFARRGARPDAGAALVVGAWFAGNVGRVVEEAQLAIGPASRHPEETAAAIAVAVAAAMAFDGAEPAGLIEAVLARTPDSAVRSGLSASPDAPIPAAIACAARHLCDYEAAVRAVGPESAAIAGGIVACRIGRQGLPAARLSARGPLPR